MKKLLSLLLAICLCAVCFVGCNTSDETGNGDGGKNVLKVEDVKNDPYGALQEASKDVGSWAKDDAEIADIIKNALESGSVELSFASDALFSLMEVEGPDSILGTLYSDAANKKGALEVTVGMGDETFGGILYVTESGIALGSEALFLSPDTYLLDFSKLLDSEVFGASMLPTLLQIPAEELPEILAALDMAGFLYTEAQTWDWAKLAEDALAGATEALNYTVSNGSIKDASGKKVSCAVISVSINAQTIKAMLTSMIDAVTIPDALLPILAGGENVTEEALKETLKAELSESFDAAIADGSLDFDFDDLTQKYYISLKTGKLVGTKFIATTVDEEYDYTSTSTVTLLYTANGIVVEMMDGMGVGEDYGYRATLAKNEKNSVVSYSLSFDVVFGTMKQNLASLTASYNKATGALKISAKAEEGPSLALDGALTKSEDEAKIAFNSLKLTDVEIQPGAISDVTIAIDFSLTFKAGTPVPEIPADAKDLVTLSEEEWGVLMENVMNSPLGELIAGLGGIGSFDYKKPTFIPEGMVEEEYWADSESVAFGYGYRIVEDGYEYVDTQYVFAAYANEQLYLEEIEYVKEWAETDAETVISIGGYDVRMISVEGGLYMFWTDGEGFYALDIYDTQFDAGDIESIITSLE